MTATTASAPPTNTIVSRRHNNILLITINRPDQCNAIDQRTATALGQALAEADQDREVRVVVLTGAGRRAFCAGADLKALARGEPVVSADHPEWGFAGWINQPVSVPLIAAVNGSALGGGTELALSCDLVIAAATASFGLPETRRGLIAGTDSAFRLIDQLPRKIAMRMLLTGRPITSAIAESLGLVNEVTPEHLVVQTALHLADQIATNAPLAVRATKRIALELQNGRLASGSEAWTLADAEFAQVLASADAQEGLKAFVEKRAPVWQGC